MAGFLLVTYVQSTMMQSRVRKAKDDLRATVLSKLGAEVDVTVADLDRFCNAHGVSRTSAKLVLDQIYAEPPTETKAEIFGRLRLLLEEVEAKQPYDHLPIEVRASLVRLDSLIGESSNQQDRALLGPILAALNDYVGFTNERKQLNLHKNFAYAIGVVSLVLGGATLYFTPSEQQLAHSVASELSRVVAPLAASDAAAEGS